MLDAAISAGIVEPAAATALIKRFDIRREVLPGQSLRLPEHVPLAVFEAISKLAGSDHGIGAVLALHADQRMFGVVGDAVHQSRTLADAYGRISRYSRLLHQGLTVSIATSASQFIVGCAMSASGHEVMTGARAASMVWTMSNLALLSRRSFGQSVAPQLIELACPAPANMEVIEEVFGDRIRFGVANCQLTFSNHDIEKIRSPAETDVLPYLDALADRDLGDLPPLLDIVELVTVELRRGLVGGTPTIKTVANSLGMSQRTLQRRIQERDSSFACILDEVRMTRAKELIGETSLPVSGIAYMLGYSEQAAFSRAARRWFGTTPRQLLQNARNTSLPPHSTTESRTSPGRQGTGAAWGQCRQ